MMRSRWKNAWKKSPVTLLSAVILLGLAISVGAWFAFANKLTRTEELVIDMPPVIYIKDDNLEEITSFRLDGLKIGEDYNTVFCVSPAVPGSVNSFFLGLIYSENLGMNINLYPVYSVTSSAGEALHEERQIQSGSGLTSCFFNYQIERREGVDGYDCKVTYGDWENEIQPGPGHLNNGVYKAYRDLHFAGTHTAGDDIFEKLNDTWQYRFFILNITWPDDVETRAENAKETDIVYIVSKGTRKSTS